MQLDFINDVWTILTKELSRPVHKPFFDIQRDVAMRNKITTASVVMTFCFLMIISVATSYNSGVTMAEESSSVVVSATINTRETTQIIDEKVYSHFLEHIYNSCNGGLWGELVWNRSLEAGRESGWSFEDGILKQGTTATDRRFLLGADLQAERPWTDYDVRVLAKKVAGSEGFLVIFRAAPDMSSYYWLNLGGWNNQYVAIEKQTPKTNGRRVIGGQKTIPPISEDEIYDIRVVVVGQNIKVFVNQELIHEVVDFDEDAPKSGCVGVGTWATKAEFGQVLVRDMRRQTLYDMADVEKFDIASPVDVRYWSVDGNAETRRGDALNSDRYLRFTGAGNLAQKDFAFNAEEKYDYSFWTRGAGKTTLFLNVGGVETKADTFDVKSDEWVKMTGTFSVPSSSAEASIRLNFAPSENASLDVDQISIFPRSWKENFDGLRPDLLQAIQDIKPTVIRWPGGCYASAYRWKSGVGPQDYRVAYPLELWNDVDVNSFGIDEFMILCRRTGAEPLMVVDVGTKQWINSVGTKEARENDWLQEVCDWLEYCNGPETSKWGAERAKNGHPEPYNVKYWEIDNEVDPRTTSSSEYVDIVNQLVPRMKAIDPNIKIIACGSFTGDKMKWDADVITGAGKNFDYLSIHRYDDPNGFAFNPWDNQKFYEAHRDVVANSENPNIKLFSSEWNAQSTDWRTGLHAGGYLNCVERVADVMEIAAPALFLRHKSATGWDNAFINFDNSRWYPAPNYVVMKLWRDSYAPCLLNITSDAPELSGSTPSVNATATKTEDGKTLYFKAVNTLPKDVEYKLGFDDGVSLSDATIKATCVSPSLSDGETADAKLRKRNTLEEPDAIAPFEVPATIDDGTVCVNAPSYSAIVVKIELK